MARHGISERRACDLVQVARKPFRREPPADRDSELRQRLCELAEQRRRSGSPRLHVPLQCEGWQVNHKRVERVYREDGLSLRVRRRRKRLSLLRAVQQPVSGPNQLLAMDFVADTLWNGRRIRTLTVMDTWNREAVWIEVDLSLSGRHVARVLDQRWDQGRRPGFIQLDHGPEFTSKALDEWAYPHGVRLQFIRPGKPVDNVHIESVNGRFREECLNQHAFRNLHDAQQKIDAWRLDYNAARPHRALGYLTPLEYREKHQPQPAQIANL